MMFVLRNPIFSLTKRWPLTKDSVEDYDFVMVSRSDWSATPANPAPPFVQRWPLDFPTFTEEERIANNKNPILT